MKPVETIGERRKWLRRMTRKDPSYARYFCARCTRYLGAAVRCGCS